MWQSETRPRRWDKPGQGFGGGKGGEVCGKGENGVREPVQAMTISVSSFSVVTDSSQGQSVG